MFNVEDLVKIAPVIVAIAGLLSSYTAIHYMNVRKGQGMADTIESLSSAQVKMTEAHSAALEMRDREIVDLRSRMKEIDELHQMYRKLNNEYIALKKQADMWKAENARLTSEVATYKQNVQMYMDRSNEQAEKIRLQEIEIERLSGLLRAERIDPSPPKE
jgi:predicted RNase H-like nuclease (RuvC/YqgF family)